MTSYSFSAIEQAIGLQEADETTTAGEWWTMTDDREDNNAFNTRRRRCVPDSLRSCSEHYCMRFCNCQVALNCLSIGL